MMQEADMLKAVRARDAAADGIFVYAVLTTGIFCFPSCAARAARPENLRFFASCAEAIRAGYRPCRRCRPDLAPRTQREAAWAEAACRAIEAGCFDLARAAEDAGISAAQFGRLFRRVAGITLGAYAAGRRQRMVAATLRASGSVTQAIYESGFASTGRFYESTDKMLGMPPSVWRRGGAGETIMQACAPCALGRVLVACTERGICAILLGENDDALRADLQARFPRATHMPAWPAFHTHLETIVQLIEQPAAAHALPLDIRGTIFQRIVWDALTKIPPGTTLSYGALAESLGNRRGARAVAAACAANRLAVAIPCHRVVNARGELAGYRWGQERKHTLLKKEGLLS